MKAAELRKAILQLAIQGKLVKQDPNDEPASVLLERIKAEKEKLIKEGKIKREKNHSYIFKGDDNSYYEKIGKELRKIDDEIPFEIPESWSIVRIKNNSKIYTGDSINETVKKKKYTGLSEGINYIGTKDVLFDHSIVYDNGVKIPFIEKMNFEIAPTGSILLCIEGGSAGRKIGFTQQDVCFGNKLCCFTQGFVYNMFLYYFLQSPQFIDVFKDNTSGIIGGVSINKIREILILLPPLEEQYRIVSKIEELMPLVDEYEKYETIDSTLDKELPEKLKKSILQHAIQGKLVKQDPNDEPASVLLERIKVEKEKLIKEGKIKRDKHESIIFQGDDKNYYENLPKNWAETQLKNVIILLSGRDLETTDFNQNMKGIPYITGASNFHNGYINVNRWTEQPKVISEINDILITCKGTIGKIGINNIGKVHIARQVMSVRTYIDVFYTKIILQDQVELLKNQATSMIPGIERNNLLNLLCILPPLDEQRKISCLVNKILNLLY